MKTEAIFPKEHEELKRKEYVMLLEASNLHKTYNHAEYKLPVLKGIDLKVESGDVLAIVGPSGAGKSTLLHVLGGLDKPDEGKVTLDGQDCYSSNDRERSSIRNKKIGFVFQFYHLLPELTALENVVLPSVVKDNLRDPGPLHEKGMTLLEQVGLSKRHHHRPNQLSGGEQQRVAIARAIINEPKIIFCDEPTGNLDSQTGLGIVQLLMELNARNHQTLVIVTHDDDIARRSHRVVHMKDGKLI